MAELDQASIADASFVQSFRVELDRELSGNILPFWIEHAVDHENGGFYGALTNDLHVLNDVPRSAVFCARILWTYATAYRAFGEEAYLAMMRRAYDYLTGVVCDHEHGGVYWQIDQHGTPVKDHKHSYAQAFAIYGLAEYYAATEDANSLRLAQALFDLLETHAHDDVWGGYVEGCARDWSALGDMRLSAKEPNSRKSMNTLLHIMEAYTNLLRVWDDQRLRARLQELIEIFVQHVIDPRTDHFRLYFDDQWHSLGDEVSYGHDIEGSWLLVEAAEVLGDPNLLAQARTIAVKMAQAVYEQGLDHDGSVLYEGDPSRPESTDKHWWVQAEAMVGFYNAYQVSGQAHFAQAALGCWRYIQAKFVDRVHGEWFKVLNRQGVPYSDRYKAGPWEDPYHHSRGCFEMLQRIKS